jgi:hemerythrin superfamily protein
MNAITLLTEQHRQVETLFEYVAESEGEEKQELFVELADLLAMHATIEERHFYPAVRDKQTDDLVVEALEEHLEVKRLLADLLRVDVGDGSFDERLEEIKEQVQQHVKAEEGELFPMVRRLLDSDALETIGRDMAATMVELADTEPRNDITAHLQ